MTTFPTIESLTYKGKLFIGLTNFIEGTHLVDFDTTNLVGQMIIATQKTANISEEEVAQAVLIGNHKGKELSSKHALLLRMSNNLSTE